MKKTEILNRIIPDYSDKLTAGQFGLGEMPLLNAISESIMLKQADYQSICIVACQHLLTPQLAMFSCFIKLGIKAENILILPKAYSANKEVIEDPKNLGCCVFEEAMNFNVRESFDSFHEKQCSLIRVLASKKFNHSCRLVVIDDGGALLKEFSKEKKFSNIYGVEQTSSGKNRLLTKELPFAVNSVASSTEKLSIETDYIIRHSLSRVKSYFSKYQIDKSKKILVIGKGPIGITMISVLIAEGYSCSGYDILDGKRISFATFDVIIGATGSQSVSFVDLSNLKRGCHLISISSSDREFPNVEIRSNSTTGLDIHDDFIHHDTGIHLANGGFPVTFKGLSFECWPLEMDVTMMKLTEAVFTNNFEASVNRIYADKTLKKHQPIIILSLLVLILILLFKVIIFGFFDDTHILIKVSVALSLAAACLPAIWQLSYYHRIEKQFKP
ncbi:MAG: hypothetical protein ACOYMB_05265 [Patescibacteria group bacterium]